MKVRASKAGRWYPWIIVGLLVTHVVGMLTAVFIAAGDHTFVAMPDYYGKAIRWDKSQEEARQSDSLGWKRTVALSAANAAGDRLLTVHVTDPKQLGISGLNAVATVYPELFPDQLKQVRLNDNGDGSYSASVAAPAAGPVVVDLRASRNTVLFIAHAVLFVGSGS